MKLLSPLDQMFARMEAPRTPMHIGAFAVFDLPKGAPRRFIRDLYEAISQLAFLPFPFDSVIAGGASMAYWRCDVGVNAAILDAALDDPTTHDDVRADH